MTSSEQDHPQVFIPQHVSTAVTWRRIRPNHIDGLRNPVAATSMGIRLFHLFPYPLLKGGHLTFPMSEEIFAHHVSHGIANHAEGVTASVQLRHLPKDSRRDVTPEAPVNARVHEFRRWCDISPIAPVCTT